ncbi:phosphate ABC transporter permease subunit PstC, partial [bacterium]|nr:phosphate ABC transporter permease subunit PstC [bacterium]
MRKQQGTGSGIITGFIRVSGYSSIVFVTLILIFLLREGIPALSSVPLSELFSTIWYPIEGYFGILPLILGTLLVTLVAILIALPFGICTAVYLSEIAPAWVKAILKPVVEILAGIPSVVLGFIGILVFVPFMRTFFN